MIPAFLFRRLISTLFLWLIFIAVVKAEVPKKYWVYFMDKGSGISSSAALKKNSTQYYQALTFVQQRALQRRAKVRSADALVDAADLPLYRPYVQQVNETGAIPQQQSRWLNAASYLLTQEQVLVIQQFPFVTAVVPVLIVHRREIEKGDLNQTQTAVSKTTAFDYGPSLTQNQMIDVPPLHTIGITGRDVLVGMLDTGFRWRIHESLQGRHVIAEYDFIQHDSVTANQTCAEAPYRCDASGQDAHGTLTMSTLGGFMPGHLIGPAFDADFILAKTEYVQVDDSLWEEDNWAAGIEWMEGYGADVISSSLGYNTFFDATNYTWAHGDFNGRTTISARAAVRAAELGVLVCNAMGNEGNGNGITGTMLTPADADSIISVGAINFSGTLASFSSTGPTNDLRIKPEVVTPGSSVYCASTFASNAYTTASGTSLATPLAAGAVTLVLSARPELNAMQVRDVIRATADTTHISGHPKFPNDFMGWGLVDAFRAALSFGPIFSNRPAATVVSSLSVVTTTTVSKFGIRPGTVLLHYAVSPDTVFSSVPMSLDSAMFYPTSGRYKATIPAQTMGSVVKFYIDAEDSSNNVYQSPASVTGKVWQLDYGVTGVKSIAELPASFTLSQNYPNPFNPSTSIQYTLPRSQRVVLKVYNVLGQEVKLLVNEEQMAGVKTVKFDARDLPSGVYFYRLSTPSFVATKKMMLVR